jgi:hypothetical protein
LACHPASAGCYPWQDNIAGRWAVKGSSGK